MSKTMYKMLFCCLLLTSCVSAASGFTQVTYPARVSSECGQYDQDEHLIKALNQVQQQLVPNNRSCPNTPHQLPQATTRYVFPMAH